MSDPSPAELRAVRAQLIDAADSFNAASADNLATLRRVAERLPSKSGQALRALVEKLTEQDRLHVAGVRDLAHHIPVKEPSDAPAEEESE